MRYIALGFLVIGFVILLYVWKNNLLYFPQQKPWSQVAGEVKDSRLVLVGEDETSGESTFKLAVDYRYTYNGEEFSGNSVFIREMLFNSRSKAQLMMDRFKPGEKIDVFVNPNRSGSPRAVLIWEMPDILHPLASLAFMFLALGSTSAIIWFIYFLLDRRKAG